MSSKADGGRAEPLKGGPKQGRGGGGQPRRYQDRAEWDEGERPGNGGQRRSFSGRRDGERSYQDRPRRDGERSFSDRPRYQEEQPERQTQQRWQGGEPGEEQNRPRLGREARERRRDENQERQANRMRPHNRLDAQDVPELPEDVTADDLAKPLLKQLSGLGKENTSFVARHLVMAQDLMQDEPELAYRHARAAADRAARVDIAREYAGLTSYYTGRYSEAARELRTFQRLSGTKHHLPLIADSLRALGQVGEAVDLAQSAKASDMDPDEWFELGLVLAGARADLGQFDAGLAQLARLRRSYLDPELVVRLDEAQSRIEALADGRLVEDEIQVAVPSSDGVVDWLEVELLEEVETEQPENELTTPGEPDLTDQDLTDQANPLNASLPTAAASVQPADLGLDGPDPASDSGNSNTLPPEPASDND